MILNLKLFSAALFFLGMGMGGFSGAQPVLKKFKILILGDSLTEGYGVEKEDAFPAKLEERLQKEKPLMEVVNGGSSGSTSASGVRRLKWYEKSRPDLIILALGSNDGLRGVKVAETRKNVEAAIVYAQGKGLQVCLAGLKVPPNYGPEYAREFEAAFQDLAEKHSLPFIDFLLEGVAGEPEMNLPDGLHPNEKGHAVIAENLYAFLSRQDVQKKQGQDK